ncbi:hypothetical protein B0H16DRAFT_1666140 [Mycena metata]|uniref:DUF6589 domain-containing protein n=1 Tax=Mycena metata TaxID=1033252 RepID=A0AAD7HN06_9AGAR|nr:hypothetical protein B0H16DRAFT_1666140 [Mycena metata]
MEDQPAQIKLIPLRAKKRSKFEKVDDVLATYGFKSLGEFLTTVFYHHRRADGLDPRTPRHKAAVTSFLQGASTFTMSDIIPLLYDHPQSRPKKKQANQLAHAFSPHTPLSEIRSARPCLSAWATRTVGDEAYRRVGLLAKKSDDPASRTHIRASTNGRKEGARVATWEDMNFSIQGLADQYREADGLVWYITESLAAPRVKGKVVIRKRRPHPVIQVGAISSFVLSRNSYASGDLALPLGVWHFVCKSHVDVKRVYCRFGSIVSDSTARNALNSMSAADFQTLQESVQDATSRHESEWGKILDNVQQHSPVYEHGLGRDNQLKVGTACTAFHYDDCEPGAFDAQDHIDRVLAEDRKHMTTESIYNSIDWEHNDKITDLHFVRVLVEYSPHLSDLSKEISELFRTVLAKHRIRVTKKKVQNLSTNSEREMTSQGMLRARGDFDKQMGIEPDKCDNILDWIRGDGGSHATLMNLKKYLAIDPNIYNSCRNVVSTPETWHTKATDLNSSASNHYGPAASKDPSSLSRSSNATNMKRPTDLKKCDFYPTSRSMTMIWEARVLDCWRLILGVDSDIHAHFEELAAIDALPTLDDLLEHAADLRARFASQAAYDLALSKGEYDSASPSAKAPKGSPWKSRSPAEPVSAPEKPVESEGEDELEMPGLADIHDGSASDSEAPAPDKTQPPPPKPSEGPKVHAETAEFDGDRVFSNAILFLMEFGWWIELNYAIPEGDVGRVLEILKIYIFTFAGTSNHNYMRYMLDLYALLQFECSPKLKEALLNNWLINLRGIIGAFIEGDLMQEHYNRWLEDMVRRRGGDFDDKFYRETISPNVQHFLEMKENIESAFELKRRGKAHTSPHLRDETRILLRMYKEEELHSFRSTRSMGHAAVNRFDRGYQRLHAGKLAEYLRDSADYASVLRGAEELRHALNSDAMVLDSDPSSPPSPPKTPELNHRPPSQPSSPQSEYSTSSSSEDSTHSTTSTKSTSSTTSAQEEFEENLIKLCGAEVELETSDEEDADEVWAELDSESDDDQDANEEVNSDYDSD